MFFAQLDEDVSSIICSFITTRRSLLRLALTCRAFHTIIIPTFLYARLEFGTLCIYSTAVKRLESFFHALRRHRSVGRAVRHLEIPSTEGLDRLWADSLPLMHHVRSLGIGWDPSPVLLKVVPTMSHLHTLSLGNACRPELIELLRGIRLQDLEISFQRECHLTPDSALGEILLRSRDTLKELKLCGIAWRFRPSSAQSATSYDDGDPIWPHVIGLRLWNVSKDSHPINLTYHFPSVLCFDISLNGQVELDQPYNCPFYAGLRSLEGSTEDLKLADDSGAKLQRAHIIVQRVVTDSDFYKLPLRSTLQSLTLIVDFEFPLHCFGRLAAMCPKVRFLALHIEDEPCVGPPFESILNNLADLPLECLYIHWDYVGEFSQRVHSSRHGKDVATFARLAPMLLSSLRFISFTSLGWVTQMRRLVDVRGVADEFTKVPEEDGADSLQYYEWRWRDQVEGRDQ
ncbi:hypothetical protein BOTBODRAFT_37037 [Botryobasidium botryosum FD-172 SS1]|uniref:F-box domain-containing protein n=1 Tax=Botryobasidium botryosum (strain FD-172 SS1) TaxID=930990 RepID=A0A067M1N0_BOTB1|nr:hypothetical protein BOTBODRAFT_37037 [Botryobasidium botryosum FD-172 SS1]